MVFTFSAITSAVSYGQIPGGSIASLDKKPEPATIKNESAEADKTALDGLRAINAKMFTHFTRNYRGASNIRVSDVQDQTSVKFDMNGISQSVRYDKKGKWLFSIKNYSEEKLSPDVRSSVESSYPGFMVFGFVNEIKVLDKTAYLVMIENSKSWKRIRVVDGETSIYEQYSKPTR